MDAVEVNTPHEQVDTTHENGSITPTQVENGSDTEDGHTQVENGTDPNVQVENTHAQVENQLENGSDTRITQNGSHAVENGSDTQVENTHIPGGTVVTINGVQMTVYGNVAGLEFLNENPAVQVPDMSVEEEEEEERLRSEQEVALARAEEADNMRRSAPIPQERCEAIMNAMRGVTIGGFRPGWAEELEEKWMSKLRELRR